MIVNSFYGYVCSDCIDILPWKKIRVISLRSLEGFRTPFSLSFSIMVFIRHRNPVFKNIRQGNRRQFSPQAPSPQLTQSSSNLIAIEKISFPPFPCFLLLPCLSAIILIPPTNTPRPCWKRTVYFVVFLGGKEGGGKDLLGAKDLWG